MLLQHIESFKLAIPLKNPITTNLHTIDKINGLGLSLYFTDDIVGFSFIYGLGNVSLDEIIYCINRYIDSAKLYTVFTSLKSWENFWTLNQSHKTVEQTFALAAMDIAIWDAFGKKENKSLKELLNIKTVLNIPAYGTTGWLSLSEDELIEECAKYLSYGISAFKIRLGHANDYDRVKAVREAMGENFTLMLDANQRYTLEEALLVAKKMCALDIKWIEEPVNGNKLKDLAVMMKKSPIPIATGENIFNKVDFENICKLKAAHILQPDLLRCGGITGFIETCQLIDKYNVFLCNHLFPNLSKTLLGSFSTAYYLEYDDLLPNDIYINELLIQNQSMSDYFLPGTGVMLRQEAIKSFKIK